MDDQSESTSQSPRDHILQHLVSTWDDQAETQEVEVVEDIEEDAEDTVIEAMEEVTDMEVVQEIDTMRIDTGIDMMTEEMIETDIMREEALLLQAMTEVILMRGDMILILPPTAMERGLDQGLLVHTRETQGQDASTDLEVVNMKGDIEKMRNE